MSKSIVVGMFTLTVSLTSLCAQADWSSKSEVGFVAARGNTTTETANARFDIAHETRRWKNQFTASGLYGRSSEIETAQRLDAKHQVDYNLSEKTFAFVSGRYENDDYSGFTYQGTASAGFGRRFFDTQATKLTAQIGAGYRSLRPEDFVLDENDAVIARIPGERQQDIVVNGAINFEHAFNDNTKVLNQLLIESGEANTLMKNDLALQVKMTEVLALSLGFSVRNNSEPQEGLKKTDTLTTVNLVYVRPLGP
jgi:putative salt-induced outer membrane protein